MIMFQHVLHHFLADLPFLPFGQWFASFWTLGANRDAYQHEAALELAHKYNVSPEGVCVLQ